MCGDVESVQIPQVVRELAQLDVSLSSWQLKG